MTQQTYHKAAFATATLTSATATDVLPGGATGLTFAPAFVPGSSACLVPGGADIIDIILTNNDTSNAAGTVALLFLTASGGTWGGTYTLSGYSVAANGGTLKIQIRGLTAAAIRVQCTAASGITGGMTADVTCYASDPAAPRAFQLIVNGTVLGAGLGGTITGNFSASGGTASIEATGALTLDATTSVTIGGTNATSVAIGASAVAPSFPGGLTVAAGKAITGGTGALTVDTTGALDLGPSLATSIVVGATAIAPSFPGGLTVGAGKSIIGGTGSLTVDTTGTLDLGTSVATAISMGAAGVEVDMLGGYKIPLGDAGAAGTSGTVNKRAGTFTLTGTTFTLTNSTIATGDLPFVTCETASPGAYIASAVVSGSGGTLTVTFSTSVTSMKCAFMLVGSG